MEFKTDYKLEHFIRDTKWNDLPQTVQQRLRGCFIDLMGALISGSRSAQFTVGLTFARRAFKAGDIAVIGALDKFDFLGASVVMGHSANAYDIDDGHNTIRAHPGASFIGGLLAAAYEKDVSMEDFLTVLYVAYETTIRMGKAIMDYYRYAHSSGTFGAVGVAAGVGRLFGFRIAELNNVLSIAEFNAPLVPGIRSVEYPSMNKDGVPFGVMVGAMSVLEAQSGFTGNKNLLEAEEYRHYLSDLGQKHEVMQLYFKPYPCCRWAHPAIDACLSLMRKNSVQSDDIKCVNIKTFYKATLLSKGIPQNADEAQYNIAYPVASAIVNNGFSIAQTEQFGDPIVAGMMQKLNFICDNELDAAFPAKRLCKAEMELNSGSVLRSEVFEPRGEASENIGNNWIIDKFSKTTRDILSKAQQDEVIAMICRVEGKMREFVDRVNSFLSEQL